MTDNGKQSHHKLVVNQIVLIYFCQTATEKLGKIDCQPAFEDINSQNEQSGKQSQYSDCVRRACVFATFFSYIYAIE